MGYPNGNGVKRGHRYTAVQRVIGQLLMLFSLAMIPPIIVDQLYEDSVTRAFLEGLWMTLTAGTLLWWPTRHVQAELKNRDGFLIAVLTWFTMSVFGAIPLFLSDQAWNDPTDALFESISGLTTTGATTVAHGIDQLPHAINFYRAFLHWLGGMSIIVLAVAVLPVLGIGGMQLFRADTPGPMKDSRLTPRISSTARSLWTIYVLLTTACGLCYWMAGMPGFDAICHAMSTVATGGFSTHDSSLAYYNSFGIELVAMVFMLFGASNFALHYLAFRERSLSVYLRDAEFRTFMMIVACMAALVCIPLVLSGIYPDNSTAIRKGVFQLVSHGTSSGFTTDNPSYWPSYTPLLLVLASFMMSCSGSTGGGVKVVRLLLFVKQAAREMKRLVHPNAEVAIKLDGKVVSNDVVYAIGGFFSVYIGLTVALSFLMMTTGLDAVTAFSAVAASINNAGVGLYGLHANVADVTDVGKWILMFSMLLGRLEIFTLLIVFTPTFWRR